ncbi:aftiphilin a isoform X4 [Oryzias latipes]
MEPDVIRMYSSSPPPMEDGAEEDEDEFGDFGTFSGVPGSISFSELDTPTTFNQTQALTATSPPELLASRGLGPELSRVNGVVLGGEPANRAEVTKVICSLDCSVKTDCNGRDSGAMTNGFESLSVQGSPPSRNAVPSSGGGLPLDDTGSPPASSPENDFADFAAFSEGLPIQTEDSPVGGHLQAGAACRNCQNDLGGAPGDTIRDTNGTGSEAELEQSCPAEAPPSPSQEVPLSREAEAPPAVNGLDGAEGGQDQPEARVSPDETETSLGRQLSTNDLEEYGDMSPTCSAPSPPIQSGTPTDSSPLGEGDEDFGDFGEPASFCAQGFAEVGPPDAEQDAEQDADDFGDFNSPKCRGPEDASTGGGSSLPVSDSFGNFSSAEGSAGWSAFEEPQQVDGDTWAEFSAETGEAGMQTAPPSSRVETLFQSCFPAAAVPLLDEQVAVLKVLLDGADPSPEPGPHMQEEGAGCRRCGGVWARLQDVHEALGLKYQWGGSHCNKALLGCLGIDTRNILFTGQKKQPVIVPMYAAGLGMLEPTKEPVKPISAAEMITAIGQVPVEDAACSPSSVQEGLPPIQFDWSSSGLTNPLDGVDPELFQLTTSKLDSGGTSGRVADAFARLMSTVEKTSTSTRKPRKDENLSEEAAKVIAALPDLSFMHAKVLMFPATLMPPCSQATPD